MLTIRKSLGQHFLKDEKVLSEITRILSERPLQRLLEVGPGSGALTKHLLELPSIELRCIEIDQEKVAYLLSTYPVLRGKIIHQDILEAEKPFDRPFTVVGNFPYNISSQIIFKMLDWKDAVEGMVGMFQKEVAQRIAAKEGGKVYGVTSVLVQTYFHVEYLFEVSETAFEPPPKVKSAVIRLTPRTDPPAIRSERSLVQLVKAAFNQRRKTLRNAVKPLFDAEILKEALFNKRAEELSVQEFAALSFRMK